MTSTTVRTPEWTEAYHLPVPFVRLNSCPRPGFWVTRMGLATMSLLLLPYPSAN